MTILTLWLPIVLAAVFVFVVSSVIHMALPIHKNDYGKLPGEDDVRRAMREQGVGPGCYMVPRPDSMADLAKPEVVAKFDEGPVAYLTVRPNGMVPMGKALGAWFLLSLLITFSTAYVASLALEPGAAFKSVLQLTGAVATMGFGYAQINDSIWKGVPWSITAKFLFDGILYGLTTGLTFAWLWPGA